MRASEKKRVSVHISDVADLKYELTPFSARTRSLLAELVRQRAGSCVRRLTAMKNRCVPFSSYKQSAQVPENISLRTVRDR